MGGELGTSIELARFGRAGAPLRETFPERWNALLVEKQDEA